MAITAGTSVSANIETFLLSANYAAARTALGLPITNSWVTPIFSGSHAVTLVATGTTVATFPAGTSTLLSNSSTATLTNKTFDTAGSGNSLSINSNAVTGVTGTGATVVLSAAPTLTGNTTVTTVNKVTITPPATSATLTIADAKALVISTSVTINGTAGTLTIPAAGTGTLVLESATQTLTNKTLTSPTISHPTMTTPILGTPDSGTLTSCTGYLASALSGLGTNVATFLAANMASGVSTFTTTPSSANLRAAVTDETGTGSLVFGTQPDLDAPAITNGTVEEATLNACTYTNSFSATTGFLGLSVSAITTASGVTLASVTCGVTHFNGSGASTVSLPDGTLVGAIIVLAYGSGATHDIVVTPVTGVNFTTITLSNLGSSATLLWLSTGWLILSTHDCVVA